jgi:hypothetical protein
MASQKTLLILWIIYGFVFIEAVDSVLFLLSHLTYFATVRLGVTFSILIFVLPIITISLYLATAYMLVQRMRIEPLVHGRPPMEFPKRLFIALLVIAIIIKPITNKLSGLFAEFNWEILNATPNEYLEFYGWFYFGIGFARWTSLIILALICMKKYYSRKIKN